MNFCDRLTILLSTIVAVGIMPVALALSPPEVSKIAKKIAVRIEGGAPGTGVIIGQQGNTYTVLTNAHVVQKSTPYTIQTFDGKIYPVNPTRVKRLFGVDLSLLEFSSPQAYETASIGQSDELNEGMTLYVGGWAATDQVNRERGYRFTEGRLSGRSPNPENGYVLIYNNVVKPGMSGSPILDEQGLLVGINGKAVTDIRTGDADYYGIPISIYLQLAKNVNTPAPNPLPSQPPAPKPFQPFSLSPLPTPKAKPPLATPTVTPIPKVAKLPDKPKVNFSLVAALTGHQQAIYTVVSSPDGKSLASGSHDRTIKIWDLETAQEIDTLSGHANSVYALAYSSNGKILASGSADKTIKLWDAATGKEIRTLTGHADSISSLAYSLDGQYLASASWDRTIKIWNIATGKQLHTLTGHLDSIDTVAYSPDGNILASGSWDKTIKIWNVGTGKAIRTLTGHAQPVDTIAYSPDGRTLASGSEDKTIKIWDVGTGKEIRTLIGHGDTVDAIAYSPDGRTLASGSKDKTIKIWDVNTGKELNTLTGSSDSVSALAYSLDGRTLISGTSTANLVNNEPKLTDGGLKIWQLPNP
jgi:uncharacterized protein YjiK